MLRTQISEKDSTIKSLLYLKQMSRDVLRDSKEEELRSVCPDLQSSCERIWNNSQDLWRLLYLTDDEDMEAIQCVCDKLRAEIAATRSQLESVQSAYDQSSCEVTKESEYCKQLEQLQGQYDSLENQWISQQGDIKIMQEDYEKIQTKYEKLLQNYVETNASEKQCPKLQAENAQILNEIATLKERMENAKLQLDQSSSYESLTKAENGKLKKQLAKIQTENHSLSTQVMDYLQENDRLQKLLDQNSSCDLKLEDADLAKNQHSRCKFFELADKILQIELHTDSEFCYLFTSTKLKGSQSTDLLRLKLYLDSAKFIEDQSCVQDSTAATILNGLIQQHKYNLVGLTNKEIEEETKEERRLSNTVSKLLKKLLSKDELLAETSTNLINLRKQFLTESNNAVSSRQKIERQISLEKDKYIEKLKTEIEKLSSSASQLEKLNSSLNDRFNVLQSKEDQGRKLLGKVQDELQKTKVELSTKKEEVEALTANYKTELETERDAHRNKICELEEENRHISTSHINELEEFKKLLRVKLEKAQADYLDAIEVRNKLKEAEAERAVLLAGMNEMNSSLEDMVSQRDSERVRVLELEKSKADLDISLKHLTIEKHELDISNKKSLDLVENLQLQLKKLGDSKDGLQAKYEKEEQEIIALQSRIKEKEAAHSITWEKFSKLKAEHEDLVAKKDSEKIALQEHADTLAAKVVDLEKELIKGKELLSTQEELKSSLSDAKNLCTERKVQIEHLKNQLNLADGEALKQNREKEKLRKDLDLALEEKKSAVAKKEDIEMQLADLKNRMSSQASKQEKQILDLNGFIKELQLKIKFLHERKEKLEADIEKNSQNSQNLEVQLREKQKALAASCESYSKLQNEFKAKIIENAKTNIGLHVNIELVKKNLLKMTEERDELQAKLETKANCEIKMKGQILKLERKLETNKARDKSHRQAVAQATKEIEQLRNEKKKFQQHDIEKNLLISNLESQLITNKSKYITELDLRDKTISSLLIDNRDKGEEICTLKDKLEKLKKFLPVAPGNGSDRNSETESGERRNRRIMDYDNNRRQSGWSNLPDSETATDAADMNGNGDERVSQEDHPVALCLPRLPHSENDTPNGK
ncbi:myosin-11-like isoform X2 [Drosophila bipectinata]